jgi:predicted ATPase/class 3 adenylate cyclase
MSEAPPAQSRRTARPLPTGTVTFLLTDIEGSGHRWESAPADMAHDVRRHYAILDEAIGAAGGFRPEEQGEGDSVVAAFERASDAVAAALEAQRRLRAEAPSLRVRMAIHTGEAQLRDDHNYMGTAVIRCARLRACAHGGQVVVSDSTASLVADGLAPGAALVDLGMHRLHESLSPQRVWQLSHADLEFEFARLRGPDEHRHNVPVATTPLVGRVGELVELHDLVGRERLVTVTGAGGVGKTRLAQRLAADLVPSFHDGVWWVDLAPVTDPSRVASVVADVAGMHEVMGLPVEVLLTRRFGESDVLVVFDNCEHLIGAVAELAQRLVDECAHVHVVATSREPLGVRGEVTWRTPSLSVPGGDVNAAEQLDSFDATRLFVERARRARAKFAVTDETATAIAQICRRLDGIPLAIELAAARVRVLPVERLAVELDQRFRVLTGGARTALARQRTLIASVDWSYELLDELEQQVLRRLSAFAGSFTLDAVEAVCGDEHFDHHDVLDVLSRLVDKSLVQLDDALGRYHLLETIRAYAIDRATAAGDLADTRDRQLAWAVELARAGAFDRTLPTVAAAEAVDEEYDNLLAALEWSLEADPAIELLGPLTARWTLRSSFADAVQWTSRLLDRIDPASEAWARVVAWATSVIVIAGGPDTGGEDIAARALAIAEQTNDTGTRARLLANEAVNNMFADFPTASAQAQRAIYLSREAGDEAGLVYALEADAVVAGNIGLLHRRCQADLDELSGHDLDGTLLRYMLPFARASLIMDTVGPAAAIRYLEASLDDALPPAPRTGLLKFLCYFAAVSGDLDRLERAMADLPPPGERGIWEHVVLAMPAWRAVLVGDHEAALSIVASVHDMMSEWEGTIMLFDLALISMMAGDHERAASMLPRPGSPRAESIASHVLALAALARGDVAGATTTAIAGLPTGSDGSAITGVIDLLEVLACCAEPDQCVRLSAAVRRLRDDTGYVLRPAMLVERLAHALERSRHELGQSRYDELWTEGAVMSLDDAVAHTRDGDSGADSS